MSKKLLDGVRVLSVEQYGAGPYGTMLLSDLGAEVIKIEDTTRGGDIARSVGPFELGENDSDFFQTFSLGKKSVSLDIKSEQGRALFEELVRKSDAVANNLRGDQPDKLGITYKHLKTVNPKIVCAHLSAYGRASSRTNWPGYDYLMQAEAGFMFLTGEPEGPPVRFGLSMVDFHTGSQMSMGILAGIINAQKTGEGCDIDVCLFDTALHQLSYPATWYLNRGYKTKRLPRGSHPTITPSQLVQTKDGWAMLMCQTPKFWDLWCRLSECKLDEDPRFSSIPNRLKHLAQLSNEVDAVMMSKTTAEWTKLLGGYVPFAPVREMSETLDGDYVEEVGMRTTVSHPEKDDGVHVLSSPFKINDERPNLTRAPKLGEHDGDYQFS